MGPITLGTIERLVRETSAPSKRSVRNRSGRTSRKRFGSERTLQAVGGTADLVGAMLEGPEGVFRALCVTVPSSRGYVGNEPYRSPNLGQRSSGAQRGQ